MKKLLISMAIGLAAFASNAAAVSWTSGTFDNGFWGPNGESLGSSTAFTMNIYFYSDDAGKTLVTQDSVATAKPNGAYNAATAYEDFAADTTYYMKAVITGMVGEDTWTREAALASFTMPDQGKRSINLVTGAGFDTETAKWGAWTKGTEPVPEPTSGLLVLMGLAGLMLRRKRA